MQDLAYTLGNIIRHLRIQKNLTQEDLAAGTQLDSMTISRIERGVRMPSISSLLLIAEALQTPADQIIRELCGPHIEVQSEPQAAYVAKKGRPRKIKPT